MSMTVRSQADQVEPGIVLGEQFTSSWFTGRLAYTFEPIPAGSRLRQEETLRPRSSLALLARPIDAAFRLRLLGRLADIRDILEDPLGRQLPDQLTLGSRARTGGSATVGAPHTRASRGGGTHVVLVVAGAASTRTAGESACVTSADDDAVRCSSNRWLPVARLGRRSQHGRPG
jgi:hypothetical protein